jgi:hypothetical protein
MSHNLLNALLDGPFKLTPRPEPVAGDLRLAWGITLVLVILGNSHGKTASLQKLHFLAHSVRTKQTRLEVIQVFAGERAPADFLVRVEPWLNRAISYAKAEGLVELKKGKSAKLTVQGIKVLDTIFATEDLMSEERAFLMSIRQKASEVAIEKIMKLEFTL